MTHRCRSWVRGLRCDSRASKELAGPLRPAPIPLMVTLAMLRRAAVRQTEQAAVVSALQSAARPQLTRRVPFSTTIALSMPAVRHRLNRDVGAIVTALERYAAQPAEGSHITFFARAPPFTTVPTTITVPIAPVDLGCRWDNLPRRWRGRWWWRNNRGYAMGWWWWRNNRGYTMTLPRIPPSAVSPTTANVPITPTASGIRPVPLLITARSNTQPCTIRIQKSLSFIASTNPLET